jgi:hypothetical protein
LIALNKEDKAKGRYTRIDSNQWSENAVQGWVKGREFPVIFTVKSLQTKMTVQGLFIGSVMI